MGLGLGRMVSFAGSQRKNLVHLIRDNAAILEVRAAPCPLRRFPPSSVWRRSPTSKSVTSSPSFHPCPRSSARFAVSSGLSSSKQPVAARAPATPPAPPPKTRMQSTTLTPPLPDRAAMRTQALSRAPPCPPPRLSSSPSPVRGTVPCGFRHVLLLTRRPHAPPHASEQHSGGADLVDQAILASELARVRHAEPARNDTALRRPTASRPAEAPE